MKLISVRSTLSTALVAASVMLASNSAIAGNDGYWTDSSGNYWRDSNGRCWRSGTWTPEKAIPSCEGSTDSDGDGIPDELDKCSATPKGLTVNSTGCEIDSDGDGIVDSLDKCAGTAKNTKVDARGCPSVKTAGDSDGDGIADALDRCPNTPKGAKVKADGCELDSDGDGIPDSLDRCPGTNSGVSVGKDGCELDSDKDGVADSADKCSNTVAGAKVDVKGCEIQDVIVLKNVTFATGSANLTSGSKTSLNEVAATLKKHSNMKVEVGGYTDDRGSKAFNVSLSERRAQSVADYLISQGANAANLTAKGYGPESPIADNSTAAGRAENRRVELRIVK